jgi:hypothetical protein
VKNTSDWRRNSLYSHSTVFRFAVSMECGTFPPHSLNKDKCARVATRQKQKNKRGGKGKNAALHSR